MDAGTNLRAAQAKVNLHAYLVLMHEFPLRPIRNEAQRAAASRMADSLLARHHLLAWEEDYLDVLGDLILRYDDQQENIAIEPEVLWDEEG